MKTNNRQLTTNNGFTLIELLTAVSIFSIVMVVSMGSIVGIFDANRKSRALKTVISNLNLALESMSKEMRFGKDYHCGSSGSDLTPRNCSSGDSYLSFKASDDSQVTYRLSGQSIEKRVDSESYIAVTAPEIVIDDLTFYTLGAGTSDNLQPKIIQKLKAHSGDGKGRSDLSLQTLVSQRVPDL